MLQGSLFDEVVRPLDAQEAVAKIHDSSYQPSIAELMRWNEAAGAMKYRFQNFNAGEAVGVVYVDGWKFQTPPDSPGQAQGH